MLGDIPGSLNPDEAVLGYTSYSFLKTGADEHGQFLPLTLKSFGDWKLPLYSYVGIIPIAIFDLNEFSTRLPSALAGIASVVLIYYLSLHFFEKRRIAFLAALFFALSPWSIYLSRAAYEVNLATTLLLGGLLAFVSYIHNKSKASSLIVSAICFGLTLFSYHSFIIFTPLFVAALVLMYRKSLSFKYTTYIAGSIFLIFLGISFYTNLGGNKSSSVLSLTDENVIYERAEKLRGDKASENIFFERLLYSKYTAAPYQLVQNYINSFSPSFLFDKGGEKLAHNLGSFGNLYVFDALLIAIGIAMLFWNREKSIKLLIVWLLLAPIPSAITRDTPNSTRLFIYLPLLILISAYGGYYLSVFLLKRKRVIGVASYIILCLLFFINVLYFLNIYFVHFNMQRVRFWHYGYEQAVELSQKKSEYKVVMRGPENFPYIYFLFYTKYDPLMFRKDVVYYPPTTEGFYYVKSFGKYSFVPRIDYEKVNKKTIYIDDTRLGDINNSIVLPNNEPILGYLISE